MDGSEMAREVVLRSHGTTDLDLVRDDSSEGSTVQLPVPIGGEGRTPTLSTPAVEQSVKTEESLLLTNITNGNLKLTDRERRNKINL